MSEPISVQVLLPDGSEREARLFLDEKLPRSLALHLPNGQTVSGTGTDFFDALKSLRGVLEPARIRLLCAGARVDVYPSGMSRSMSDGRKAYILSMGAPAERTALVDIFSYAAPAAVGSVTEQEAHHEDWKRSLRLSATATNEQPYPEEIEEARRHPTGWVYRIAGRFAPDQGVPPEAIVGAWQVGPDGRISGPFVPNPRYDEKKWPRLGREGQ